MAAGCFTELSDFDASPFGGSAETGTASAIAETTRVRRTDDFIIVLHYKIVLSLQFR